MTIADTAGIITVQTGKKPHVYDILCWEGIKYRWFRWCRRFFALQNMAYVLSPYIHYGPPVRHFNPLPVEYVDPSMA
jgi:hypothetical protein